ncbi:GFA family protein [Parasalinivibrio latis]|uniref:GFA family protein n=1 Tax=Parasalinivibrio latis TaxID=2952610 RepID=UPI003DA3F7B7
MIIAGECLCGKVSYKVTGNLIESSHCHCSMCRRQHGTAFATYAEVIPEQFKWTSGEEHIKIYETSHGGGWCFCNACGSTLAGTENGVVTSVTLGTVIGNPGISPSYHIFVSSKASWYHISDSLPQFDKRKKNGNST